MARIAETILKKHASSITRHKIKSNNYSTRDKSSYKRNILQHLLHPDYILFDWEFFSNQLEFE